MPEGQQATQILPETVFLDYTQEELNWQYDHSKRFGDTSIFTTSRMKESARVRGLLKCQLDVAYGPGEDETLDIFPAERKDAPIVVFIHGGAWLRGHKDNCSYLAENLVPAGITYIATNFSSIPTVNLDEMVRQNQAALAWVHQNAASFGGDPNRIHVTGHSSGGHLSGMMLVTDWEKQYGLPHDLIKGASCFSGMYNLEAVRLTHRNAYLKLDKDQCRRNSAIHNIADYGAPLIIGCGEFDTLEFHRQPLEFAKAWEARGYQQEFIELEGLHHFVVADAYGDPESPLHKALLKQIGI